MLALLDIIIPLGTYFLLLVKLVYVETFKFTLYQHDTKYIFTLLREPFNKFHGSVKRMVQACFLYHNSFLIFSGDYFEFKNIYTFYSLLDFVNQLDQKLRQKLDNWLEMG